MPAHRVFRRLSVMLMAGVLAACSGLPSKPLAPKVSVAGLGINSVGLFEQRFDVSLRVNNPNDFDISIEALEFELEVNGRPFATALARTATRVPALSSTLVQIEAVTQSKNLIRQIETLPPDFLRTGMPYRIRGRIRIDRASDWMPFDHRGVYGGDDKKTATSGNSPGI